MANWTRTVLLLLCCVFSCWAVGCDVQGPENCTFETDVDLPSRTSKFTWCSWTGDQNWDGFYSINYPWMQFTGLSKTEVTGRMTSRVSCSTQGQEFCFLFRYKFDVADEIDLNVYIQNAVFQSENKVWSASTGFLYYFQQAYIPISTQYDYAVVFEATRRSAPILNNELSVSVDDLQFVPSPCPTCFTEGPENCTFQIDYSFKNTLFTPCSWTSSGGWSGLRDTSSPQQIDPGFDWNETYGQLTSRPACSTNGQTHCLMFDYKFPQNHAVNLTVYVHNIENGNSKTMLWSATQVPLVESWERAKVSIRTSFNFVVIFEATRLSTNTLNSHISAYIDNVAYVCNPCTSPTLPPRPTTTTSPPTSTSTTRPTTSTSASSPTTLNISPQTTFFTSPGTTTQSTSTRLVTTQSTSTRLVTTQSTFTSLVTTQSTSTSLVTTQFTSTSLVTTQSTIDTSQNTLGGSATPESAVIAGGLVAAAAVIVTVGIIVTVIQLIVYRRCRNQRYSTPGPQTSYVFSNAAAVNVDNSPAEGADYDNIAEDPYSRPNAPSTSLEAKASTDHGRSFNVDQGAVGSAAMTAADDGNTPVLFPSELYSGLTRAVHEQHHYSKLQARRKQSEKHVYVNP